MICVSIEIREGAVTNRVQISAPSIERALKVAGEGKPARRVRLLFPHRSRGLLHSRGLRLEGGGLNMVGEDGQHTNEADCATEGGGGACPGSPARVGTQRRCGNGLTKKRICNE